MSEGQRDETVASSMGHRHCPFSKRVPHHPSFQPPLRCQGGIRFTHQERASLSFLAMAMLFLVPLTEPLEERGFEELFELSTGADRTDLAQARKSHVANDRIGLPLYHGRTAAAGSPYNIARIWVANLGRKQKKCDHASNEKPRCPYTDTRTIS